MTVQELIDELNKVEDKSKKVFAVIGEKEGEASISEVHEYGTFVDVRSWE